MRKYLSMATVVLVLGVISLAVALAQGPDEAERKERGGAAVLIEEKEAPKKVAPKKAAPPKLVKPKPLAGRVAALENQVKHLTARVAALEKKAGLAPHKAHKAVKPKPAPKAKAPKKPKPAPSEGTEPPEGVEVP